jgi:hypothetical protein
VPLAKETERRPAARPATKEREMSLPISRRWAIGAGGIAVAAIVAVFAFALFTTLTASADSSVVHDPKGDAQSATESANQVGDGTPDDVARPYLDIKQAKITKKEGKDEYTFSMVLGGPVPDDPSTGNCYGLTGPAGDSTTVLVNPPDPSACFFAWNWTMSEEPVIAGSGNLAPTIRWTNGAYQALAFRNGGGPIPLDNFTISGAKISVTVEASVVESHVDISDGFYFINGSRNHRIDVGGDPFVGIADITDWGQWDD